MIKCKLHISHVWWGGGGGVFGVFKHPLFTEGVFEGVQTTPLALWQKCEQCDVQFWLLTVIFLLLPIISVQWEHFFFLCVLACSVGIFFFFLLISLSAKTLPLNTFLHTPLLPANQKLHSQTNIWSQLSCRWALVKMKISSYFIWHFTKYGMILLL